MPPGPFVSMTSFRGKSSLCVLRGCAGESYSCGFLLGKVNCEASCAFDCEWMNDVDGVVRKRGTGQLRFSRQEAAAFKEKHAKGAIQTSLFSTTCPAALLALCVGSSFPPLFFLPSPGTSSRSVAIIQPLWRASSVERRRLGEHTKQAYISRVLFLRFRLAAKTRVPVMFRSWPFWTALPPRYVILIWP